LFRWSRGQQNKQKILALLNGVRPRPPHSSGHFYLKNIMEKLGITRGDLNKDMIGLFHNRQLDIFFDNNSNFLTEDCILEYISTLKKTLSFIANNVDFVENHKLWLEDQKRVHLESMSHQNVKKEKKEKLVRLTNIYIMKDNHTGHYKIGRSDRPTKREATLLSQKSSIELLFFFPGTTNQEKMLHEIFQDKWVRGEWFALTDGDLEFIKNI
jgi:hypothetical protein